MLIFAIPIPLITTAQDSFCPEVQQSRIPSTTPHFVTLFKDTFEWRVQAGEQSCSMDCDTATSPQQITSARELVEKNTFIDVPDYTIAGLPDSIRLDPQRRAKIDTAQYRFIRNMEYDGTHYSIKIASGSEINIDQSLFDEFVKMFVTDKNEWIDRMIEYKKIRGDKSKIVMTDITDPEYHECLLDGRNFFGVIEIK